MRIWVLVRRDTGSGDPALPFAGGHTREEALDQFLMAAIDEAKQVYGNDEDGHLEIAHEEKLANAAHTQLLAYEEQVEFSDGYYEYTIGWVDVA